MPAENIDLLRCDTPLANVPNVCKTPVVDSVVSVVSHLRIPVLRRRLYVPLYVRRAPWAAVRALSHVHRKSLLSSPTQLTQKCAPCLLQPSSLVPSAPCRASER